MKSEKSRIFITVLILNIAFIIILSFIYNNRFTDKDNNLVIRKALLIGTFHFSNFNPKNNLDVSQTSEVDVLSRENQQELELISDKIIEFNPTKIFVEYPYTKQDKLDSIYTSFNQELNYAKSSRHEISQLAFRAAKKLKHEKVYAYDYRKTMFPYEEMLSSMKKAGQKQLIEKEKIDTKAWDKKYNEIVESTKSVLEVLYFLNEEKERVEDIGWYLNVANAAGTTQDTIGSFLASEWYRRNLRMYSLIQKRVAKSDERILIISGSSHVAMFKDFIGKNPNWKTVELKELMEQ